MGRTYKGSGYASATSQHTTATLGDGGVRGRPHAGEHPRHVGADIDVDTADAQQS